MQMGATILDGVKKLRCKIGRQRELASNVLQCERCRVKV